MQQLKIEGQLIASCDFWKSSAPYRNVTAGEILSDLPRLKNGASKEVLPYTNEPLTHVQKLLRWNDTEHAYATSVRDHVTKSLTLLEQDLVDPNEARGWLARLAGHSLAISGWGNNWSVNVD